MKYKRLTIEELKALEPEFINFLSSAQITANDWEKMKVNELNKVEEMLDVFSDMVYEKVMSKIKFLEYRDEKTLNVFNCTDDKIYLVGIRIKEKSKLNLLDTSFFNQWKDDYKNELSLIKNEKLYEKDRGVEVFELLQSGCLITDNRLYDMLCTIK